MIERLKPYPEHKDSGLPWLGRVPMHWQVLPLAALAFPKSIINQVDRELLSVYLQQGVVRFSDVAEKRTNATSEDLSSYQAVDTGDFVLNNQQAWRGSVGISKYKGIVSPAYLVLSLSSRFLPSYANLLFRDWYMVAQYLVCSKGVGTIQRNLYWPQLKRVGTLLPPTSEQASIVRFLDHVTRRLDKAIRDKRKIIALLNEQKQAIIHRAVTRGLDPNAPLKDSGIPWLGDIPQHWDLSPNRALLRIRKVLVGERHPQFQLLSLTKRGVIVRDLSEMRGKFSADMGTSQEVRSGDLVFCLFDVPETPRTVGLSLHDGMITGAYTVMECSNLEMAKFLELFYIAMDDHKLLSPMYSGLRNTIPKDRFLGAKTPIPPASERAAILAVVQNETASLNRATSRFEREIDLLREYRTRLVADVVTGKFDVREAVERLPEVEDTTGLDLSEDEADDELEEAA